MCIAYEEPSRTKAFNRKPELSDDRDCVMSEESDWKAELDEFPDDEVLQAIADLLRANDGELWRALLGKAKERPSPEGNRLVEVLTRHPLLRELIPH